jgi:hypothetical protein
MDWIPYLPPLFSIYLILISGAAKAYLRSRISEFVLRTSVNKNSANRLVKKAGLDPEEEKLVVLINLFWTSKEAVVGNIALDWATRLNFFNSMFAALFSVFSIYSGTNSIEWLVITLVPLLAVFAVMFFWILKYDIDGLISVRTGFLNLTPATICKAILVLVNLILAAAIYSAHRHPKT